MKKEYFLLVLTIVFLLVSYYFLMETPFLFNKLNYGNEKITNTSIGRNEINSTTTTNKEATTTEEENSNKENEINYSTSSQVVNAVYLTAWSAGSKSKIDYVLNLAKNTDINAVIINVKDYQGYITYDTEIEEAEKYGSKKVMIPNLEETVKKLKDENIYTIARIPVFQDKLAAEARPGLAVHDKQIMKEKNIITSTSSTGTTTLNYPSLSELSTTSLWRDNIELSWIDPAAKEYWDYIIKISEEVTQKGFDEVNFDYIRFPSDGSLKNIYYPHWDGKSREKTINSFFEYLHDNLATTTISADLFGLATVNYDDLGIGQKIESAYGYFDYVCPMIYPSHFTKGFLNMENPAQHPYKVIKDSMGVAQYRLDQYKIEKGERETKLRPWLQDFDLHDVTYSTKEVKKQIKATKDALNDNFVGYMLWSPHNLYTEEAPK